MIADAVVAGGGPAGLVTALALRRRGLSVAVFDRAAPPVDKPCGEGLMPDALGVLERLGVDLGGLGRPFVGIRYLEGGLQADGRFRGRPGLGLRRTALHRALAAAARAAGVSLHWRTPVEGLLRDGEEIAGLETANGSVEARHVVAADGLRSPLRHAAGLDGPAVPRARERFGVRRHYATAPWSDRVEVYWADGVEAYVTPVADDEVGVALLWRRDDGGGFDRRLAAFPPLARRLRAARPSSRDRGCGPLRQRVRAVCRGRLALVGDAAGYVDAITGEGLALAFHQAEILADCLAGGSLASYPRAHRRIGRVADRLTRLVLWIEARPSLRRRLIRALAEAPETFSDLLAVHAREVPFFPVGLAAAARLAPRLIAG